MKQGGTGFVAKGRRSQRVILSIGVIIRSEGGEAPFEEETRTLLVNAHGALVGLNAKVAKDQKVRVINRVSKGEQVCAVKYIGPVAEGKVQVGIEFESPAPEFWGITFPPDDGVLASRV